jgi:gliding motility-associated-like protein
LYKGSSYQWSNGATTQSISVNQTGDYFVRVADSIGCPSVSDTLHITVLPSPIVSIDGNSTGNYGSFTQLFASGGETYSWQPPTGLSCTDCSNPIVQPTVPIHYTVTVTDSNGCVNTKTVYVNIKTDGCIYIPNIFSPNKDAQNEDYCLYGSCLKSGTFTIYNRWGEKVFETTDMKQCWDGTYKGEPVDSDVFVYKLNGVLVTGEVVEETGGVQVAR